jgi:hypothetical protein
MIMTGLTGGNRKKKITADDADYIGKGKCNWNSDNQVLSWSISEKHNQHCGT